MDVGKPSREYIVEPVEDPVPREAPEHEPERDVSEPQPIRPPSP
jgi:hypothetical protein